MNLLFSLPNCCFLFVGVVLSWWLYTFLTTKQRHPLLYYHQGYPFFGVVKDFNPRTFLKTAVEYPKRFGPFVEYFLFGKRGILITEIETCKEILMKRPKKFRRMSTLEYSSNVLNTRRGLFQSNGTVWNHIRKSTAPSFSNQNVMSKFPKIVEEMFLWIERLGNESGGSVDKGVPTPAVIDMKYQAFSLTIRVITIVAFGLETTDPVSSYFFSSQFMKDMESMFRFSVESALFFLPRWCWKYISSKYQYEKAAREADQRMVKSCNDVINHKRELMNSLSSNYNVTSMIDSMLTKAQEEKENALTDEEIMANIKTIYFAGSDTTAVVISWISYFFALYPTICEEVRAEAETVIFSNINKNGSKTRAEIISSVSFDITSELPVTSACIKEVLRLCGPASTNGCQVSDENDSVTLSNGIEINRGNIVWVNMDGIHMDENIFKNPTEFKPHRWLTKDEDELKNLESHFIPFGYGPRICPGLSLALHEAVLAASFLAYHYNIVLNCPKEEILRIRSFTAAPSKMPILLTKVNQIVK
jgi:cytochrome P450